MKNNKLCNYADNNIQCSVGKNLSVIKSNLGCNFLIMNKWFQEKRIVLSPGKCHDRLIRNKSHDDKMFLTEYKIKEVMMKNY